MIDPQELLEFLVLDLTLASSTSREAQACLMVLLEPPKKRLMCLLPAQKHFSSSVGAPVENAKMPFCVMFSLVKYTAGVLPPGFH